MDPQLIEIFRFVGNILPFIAVIVVAGVAGSLLSTWLKIKNGYPLQNSWGMPIHPKTDREAGERISLLTSENVKLRAEIGSLKDRMETVERIVTDAPNKLARDIDSLTIGSGGRT